MNSVTLKVPQNILTLTTEEKRIFLDSFDDIFADIDGVLWNLSQPIVGAGEGFKELQNAGKKVRFLTNSSVRSAELLARRFEKIGLDYKEEEIIHPVKSVIEYLNNIQFNGQIFLIAAENFKKLLREAGFEFIEVPSTISEESIVELYKQAHDKHSVKAVIIDADASVSYNKLLRAQYYLQNPECLLITGATDMTFPLSKGVNLIGPGVFGKLISEMCSREPTSLGKPGKDLAELLIKRFKIKHTKRALMIGDMLEQDIGFGKRCGFQTLVVLSGGCSYEDLNALDDKQLLPDYYAESMGDFVEFMEDLHMSSI